MLTNHDVIRLPKLTPFGWARVWRARHLRRRVVIGGIEAAPRWIAKSAGVSEIKSRMPVKENTKIGSRARMATSL